MTFRASPCRSQKEERALRTKRYKVIMTEDNSIIAEGFHNTTSAASFMAHHEHYSVLNRKEWRVVPDEPKRNG